MKQEEICKRLIDSTITVVAREGLEKTTTKAISLESGINETNIYRFFADKDDLLAKVFVTLDCELVSTIMFHMQTMYMEKIDFRTRCRLFFNALWKFLLQNPDRCMTFIRYYYSPYFSKYSLSEHRLRFQPIINEFALVFKTEADLWMICNHVLNTMLDFAVNVFNGEAKPSKDMEEHVFRVLYASISLYRKDNPAPLPE